MNVNKKVSVSVTFVAIVDRLDEWGQELDGDIIYNDYTCCHLLDQSPIKKKREKERQTFLYYHVQPYEAKDHVTKFGYAITMNTVSNYV